MILRSSRTLALVGLSLGSSFASATLYTWDDSNGIATRWATGGNWTSQNPSGRNAIANPYDYSNELLFNYDKDGAFTNNFDGTFLLTNLTFARQSYALTGNTLGFAGRGTLRVGDGDTSIANAIDLASGAPAKDAFVTFEVDGPALTLTGAVSGTGTLVKSGAGALVLSGTNRYTGGLRLTGGTLVTASNGALAGGDLTITGGGLNLNGYSPTIRDFVIGASPRNQYPIVYGTGSLNLNGNVTYAGPISRNYNFPTMIGASVVLSSGMHTLTDTGGANQGIQEEVAFTGGISGTGGLRLNGVTAWSLSGVNTYSGGTVVDSGTLLLKADNTLPQTGDLTVNGGKVFLYGVFGSFDPFERVTEGTHQTVGTFSGTGGTVYLKSGSLTVGGAKDSTYSGRIMGQSADLVGLTSAFVKQGTGVLTLSGDNQNFYPDGDPRSGTLRPYTFSTTLQAGTLRMGSNEALGGSAASYAPSLTLAGGTLDLNGHTHSVNALFLGDGTATNVGSVKGAGTLALGGDVTFNGAAGLATKPAQIGANVVLASGGHTFGDNGQLGAGGATAEFSGVISGAGSVTKTGAGTLTFSGADTYTGGTTISGGTLVVTSPNGNYVNNATLNLRIGDGATIAGSTITGSGQLVKSGAGTLTITGASGYTGPTFLQGGTLKVGGGFAGSVTGAKGTTFQIDAPKAALLSASVSGEGDFVKTGAGGVLLAGTLSNTGATKILGGSIYATSEGAFGGLELASGTRFVNDSSGTISFTRPVVTQGEFSTLDGSKTVFKGLVSGAGGFSGFGTVDFQGGYRPGNSPAAVTFQGDMTLSSTNDLVMELGGTTLGTGYDHLTVQGLATLGGTLTVAYYGGFTATEGQRFDLFDFAGQTGRFSSLLLPTLGNGLTWDTSGLYTNGVISVAGVQATPEPVTMGLLAAGVGLATLRRRSRAG